MLPILGPVDRTPKYGKAGIVCIVVGSGPQFGDMLNRFFHRMKFFKLLLIAWTIHHC